MNIQRSVWKFDFFMEKVWSEAMIEKFVKFRRRYFFSQQWGMNFLNFLTPGYMKLNQNARCLRKANFANPTNEFKVNDFFWVIFFLTFFFIEIFNIIDSVKSIQFKCCKNMKKSFIFQIFLMFSFFHFFSAENFIIWILRQLSNLYAQITKIDKNNTFFHLKLNI